MVLLDRLIVHDEAPRPDGSYASDRAVSHGRGGILLWSVIAAWILLLAGDGASSFIYFQF
jgi:hypothetical protein